LQRTHSSSPGMKLLIPAAAIYGFIDALIGNPADIANVRIQNDSSLPPHMRRNYRSVIHAIFRIRKGEGLYGYYRGPWVNCSRAAVIKSCQFATCDGLKTMLIDKAKLRDCKTTHLAASISSRFISTTFCSPIDVVKTQLMSRTGGRRFLSAVTERSRKKGFC
jgi:dicarboxylate transporter 10